MALLLLDPRACFWSHDRCPAYLAQTTNRTLPLLNSRSIMLWKVMRSAVGSLHGILAAVQILNETLPDAPGR